MSSLSAAPAEGNTPVLFCVVLFCVVLCCCVWELFFHSRLSFHFFCKRSFDTWSLYFYISIPSLDLLYSRDDLLFVTLSIICFLIAFLIGEVGGAGAGPGAGGVAAVSMSGPTSLCHSLIRSCCCYLLTPDSFCACACLKSTALWSIQNE